LDKGRLPERYILGSDPQDLFLMVSSMVKWDQKRRTQYYREKYRNDPEFRERMKGYAKKWQRKNRDTLKKRKLREWFNSLKPFMIERLLKDTKNF